MCERNKVLKPKTKRILWTFCAIVLSVLVTKVLPSKNEDWRLLRGRNLTFYGLFAAQKLPNFWLNIWGINWTNHFEQFKHLEEWKLRSNYSQKTFYTIKNICLLNLSKRFCLFWSVFCTANQRREEEFKSCLDPNFRQNKLFLWLNNSNTRHLCKIWSVKTPSKTSLSSHRFAWRNLKGHLPMRIHHTNTLLIIINNIE